MISWSGVDTDPIDVTPHHTVPRPRVGVERVLASFEDSLKVSTDPAP